MLFLFCLYFHASLELQISTNRWIYLLWRFYTEIQKWQGELRMRYQCQQLPHYFYQCGTAYHSMAKRIRILRMRCYGAAERYWTSSLDVFVSDMWNSHFKLGNGCIPWSRNGLGQLICFPLIMERKWVYRLLFQCLPGAGSMGNRLLAKSNLFLSAS